jgi:N-sulfoglucosamine sulfohydrolase
MLFRIIFIFSFLISTLAAAERNVVLIVADDHGQDTGAYGNSAIKTPNLDKLASGGTLFTNAFATTASCSASRSVILSGLFNHRNGQYGHQHDYHHFQSFENLRTLPVLLADAGYRTASIGKYHVAPEAVYHFEEYLPGNSRNPVEMANNSEAFIRADSDRPFFLYFCTSDPHRGGGVVEQSQYKPDRFGNLDKGYPGIKETVYNPADVIVPPFLPDNPATREELAQYYQSVSRVDQGVGRLVEVLKSSGAFENTLIIYISDHGMAFPGAKTTVYEPGLKSPCIVRHPGASNRGIINQALISWVDLTPTILDFAGVEPPKYEPVINNSLVRSQLEDTHGLHGRSFLAILDQENPEGWDEIFASHTFHEIQMYYPMRVVRNRDYKLIWNIAWPLPYPFASDLWAASTWQYVYRQGMDTPYGSRTVRQYIHRPEFELYDIKADPWEKNNLADDPEYSKILETMIARMKQIQVETTDPWLLKWQYE